MSTTARAFVIAAHLSSSFRLAQSAGQAKAPIANQTDYEAQANSGGRTSNTSPETSSRPSDRQRWL